MMIRLLARNAEERNRLIGKIARAMREVPRKIQLRQIAHFTKADPAYGAGVAEALRISREERNTALSSSDT